MNDGNGELSIMEAINILSNMAEVDIKDFSQKGEDTDDSMVDIDWKDPRKALLREPVVRETFRVLHCYLQNMVRKDQNILVDAQTMKGIQAIMVLAQEAAGKMDKYAKLNPGESKPVSSLKEYTDLQKYYKQQILKQMPSMPDVPEDWEEELEDAASALAETRKGLSDLEIVRKDERYELFYIKDEDNKRYFNRSLLRHIRLIGNFDEFLGKVEGEDPLLQLREVLDREVYEGARTMLENMVTYIDDFYREAKIRKDLPLVWNMNKALMALRMAANSKNLIENQSFKSCLEYYNDFHRFLRLSMDAPGYFKRITGEMEEDQLGHTMLRMTHALCCNLFMRKTSQNHMMKMIHAIIKRGNELLGPRQKGHNTEALSFWERLREDDENLRHLLKHYPNGPILRILDSFREEEEFEGFDPLMHGNFPAHLLTFEKDQLHLTVLRLPCPTKQVYINRAELIEEFRGLLRFYKLDLKADKHLIVNVQNRTSWEDFARCKALEDATIRAELCEQFFLLGLAKGTPFYNQEDDYETMGGAPVFIEQFAEQIVSGGSCGYYLPNKVKIRVHEDFIKDGMALCHKEFFNGKAHLTRSERFCFIDIFYVMYAYRIIDLLEIDSVSFTCKDAIDAGMAQTAIFYAFTRLVSDPKGWGEEDRNQLLLLLYAPALFIRERAILKEPFTRAVLAMEAIHRTCLEKGDKVGKALNKLYDNIQFPIIRLES